MRFTRSGSDRNPKPAGKRKSPPQSTSIRQTCDGEWGEIQFDFESGTAEIVRLADWDTTVTNIFAKRAIEFLLDCGAEKLPKETMIVFER